MIDCYQYLAAVANILDKFSIDIKRPQQAIDTIDIFSSRGGVVGNTGSARRSVKWCRTRMFILLRGYLTKRNCNYIMIHTNYHVYCMMCKGERLNEKHHFWYLTWEVLELESLFQTLTRGEKSPLAHPYF